MKIMMILVTVRLQMLVAVVALFDRVAGGKMFRANCERVIDFLS